MSEMLTVTVTLRLLPGIGPLPPSVLEEMQLATLLPLGLAGPPPQTYPSLSRGTS